KAELRSVRDRATTNHAKHLNELATLVTRRNDEEALQHGEEKRTTLATLPPQQIHHAQRISIQDFVNSDEFLKDVLLIVFPMFDIEHWLGKARCKLELVARGMVSDFIDPIIPDLKIEHNPEPEGKPIAPFVEPWDEEVGPSDPSIFLQQWAE
ncbi:hypothetical protein Dimus_010653, partial [Dionaea muscipula]